MLAVDKGGQECMARIQVVRGSGAEPVTTEPPDLTSNRSSDGLLLKEHKVTVGDFQRRG